MLHHFRMIHFCFFFSRIRHTFVFISLCTCSYLVENVKSFSNPSVNRQFFATMKRQFLNCHLLKLPINLPQERIRENLISLLFNSNHFQPRQRQLFSKQFSRV